MAYLGIPLLLLGAVGVYAYIQERKKNPTPVTDGGQPDATSSSNPANKGGPFQVAVASGGGPITNPGVNTTALLPKLPGSVRGDLEKGQRPYNSLQDKRPRNRPSTGYDLYPADGYVASSGENYQPPGASEYHPIPLIPLETRPSPETASIGMPVLPKPLSNVINAAVRGTGSSPKGQNTLFVNAMMAQLTSTVDRVGPVPRDYRKISASAGDEPPQAGDMWDSQRSVFIPQNIIRRNAQGRSDRRWSIPLVTPAAGTRQLHLNGKVTSQ